MQMHLFACKSDSVFHRQMGQHKLQACMLFLRELRESHWAADVVVRLFQRAESVLCKEVEDSTDDLASQPYTSKPGAAQMTPPSTIPDSSHTEVETWPQILDPLHPDFALLEPSYYSWMLGSER
jgi:hypothetical protein